eukprot:TRINITY_DN879_c0_g10_i1.p1 TRINITY_DN879_c0_g10~~TRINITY_DN879_c0_g10_i1.p1  ORF type:complete len:1365 (+),score=337.00 TRINITY_DN879_c0_g10_i1:278-4096(+)
MQALGGSPAAPAEQPSAAVSIVVTDNAAPTAVPSAQQQPLAGEREAGVGAAKSSSGTSGSAHSASSAAADAGNTLAATSTAAPSAPDGKSSVTAGSSSGNSGSANCASSAAADAGNTAAATSTAAPSAPDGESSVTAGSGVVNATVTPGGRQPRDQLSAAVKPAVTDAAVPGTALPEQQQPSTGGGPAAAASSGSANSGGARVSSGSIASDSSGATSNVAAAATPALTATASPRGRNTMNGSSRRGSAADASGGGTAQNRDGPVIGSADPPQAPPVAAAAALGAAVCRDESRGWEAAAMQVLSDFSQHLFFHADGLPPSIADARATLSLRPLQDALTSHSVASATDFLAKGELTLKEQAAAAASKSKSGACVLSVSWWLRLYFRCLCLEHLSAGGDAGAAADSAPLPSDLASADHALQQLMPCGALLPPLTLRERDRHRRAREGVAQFTCLQKKTQPGAAVRELQRAWEAWCCSQGGALARDPNMVAAGTIVHEYALTLPKGTTATYGDIIAGLRQAGRAGVDAESAVARHTLEVLQEIARRVLVQRVRSETSSTPAPKRSGPSDSRSSAPAPRRRSGSAGEPKSTSAVTDKAASNGATAPSAAALASTTVTAAAPPVAAAAPDAQRQEMAPNVAVAAHLAALSAAGAATVAPPEPQKVSPAAMPAAVQVQAHRAAPTVTVPVTDAAVLAATGVVAPAPPAGATEAAVSNKTFVATSTTSTAASTVGTSTAAALKAVPSAMAQPTAVAKAPRSGSGEPGDRGVAPGSSSISRIDDATRSDAKAGGNGGEASGSERPDLSDGHGRSNGMAPTAAATAGRVASAAADNVLKAAGARELGTSSGVHAHGGHTCSVAAAHADDHASDRAAGPHTSPGIKVEKDQHSTLVQRSCHPSPAPTIAHTAQGDHRERQPIDTGAGGSKSGSAASNAAAQTLPPQQLKPQSAHAPVNAASVVVPSSIQKTVAKSVVPQPALQATVATANVVQRGGASRSGSEAAGVTITQSQNLPEQRKDMNGVGRKRKHDEHAADADAALRQGKQSSLSEARVVDSKKAAVDGLADRPPAKRKAPVAGSAGVAPRKKPAPSADKSSTAATHSSDTNSNSAAAKDIALHAKTSAPATSQPHALTVGGDSDAKPAGIQAVSATQSNQAASSGGRAAVKKAEAAPDPPKEGIAQVNVVHDNSPASACGLCTDDFLLSFGPHSQVTLASARDFKAAVQAAANTPTEIWVQRPGVGRLRLSLTPQAWSGQGLLGCTVHMNPQLGRSPPAAAPRPAG